MDKLELIKRLVNIGDTKTLVCHPAGTIHRHLNDEELKKAGASKVWYAYVWASSMWTI